MNQMILTIVNIHGEQVNTGVTNWISNHLSKFTSMVTTAVNNYLSAHAADFKGETKEIQVSQVQDYLLELIEYLN